MSPVITFIERNFGIIWTILLVAGVSGLILTDGSNGEAIILLAKLAGGVFFICSALIALIYRESWLELGYSGENLLAAPFLATVAFVVLGGGVLKWVNTSYGTHNEVLLEGVVTRKWILKRRVIDSYILDIYLTNTDEMYTSYVSYSEFSAAYEGRPYLRQMKRGSLGLLY